MTDKRFRCTNISSNGMTGLFWLGKDQLSVYDVLRVLNDLADENEQLKFGNKNLKAILNDFINILNRLQANPTDKQTLGVARDMLQNMGVDLE